MTIEPITSAAMTYQGSASVAERKPALEPAEVQTPLAGVQAPQDSVRLTTENTSANPQEDKKQEQEKQNGQIRKAVEDINRNSQQTEAIFGIHEGTNRVTIKIVDKQSREVVKEYPPEKTLDMIEKVWEMAGLMVDEKR